MIKSLILLIALSTVISCSQAQDTSTLKRRPYTLEVAVDDNNFYEENINATPYLLPRSILQLYPGESVYIEVEQVDGLIKSMTAVPQIKDSSKTLSISFTQVKKGKAHESMMLKVENPFPYDLIYKAKIYLYEQKKWVNTDVYPVVAKLSAYESWPEIILTIALGGWNFKTK